MSDYKTLRTWALFLMVLGVVSVISAGIGVVSLAIAVDGFWDTVGVLFLGAPIALLLASWPLALGQALRALADIGDRVVVPVEAYSSSIATTLALMAESWWPPTCASTATSCAAGGARPCVVGARTQGRWWRGVPRCRSRPTRRSERVSGSQLTRRRGAQQGNLALSGSSGDGLRQHAEHEFGRSSPRRRFVLPGSGDERCRAQRDDGHGHREAARAGGDAPMIEAFDAWELRWIAGDLPTLGRGLVASFIPRSGTHGRLRTRRVHARTRFETEFKPQGSPSRELAQARSSRTNRRWVRAMAHRVRRAVACRTGTPSATCWI